MKQVTYWGLFIFVTLLLLPPTADAFSRRSHHSETMQTQTVTAPILPDTIGNGGSGNVSAQAVPEPPVLLLMSIALGVFAVCSVIRRSRKA
jgi:hypothetical protein